MKKLISGILAMVLFVAACGCAFGESAVPAFTEKALPVVRESLDTTETAMRISTIWPTSAR